MTIEPNGYKILKDENAQIKHEIDKQKNYNMSHAQRISELKKENTQLKKEIDDFYYEQSKLKESDFYIKTLKNQLFKSYLKQQQQERLITELKTALSSYNNFVDEMFPD